MLGPSDCRNDQFFKDSRKQEGSTNSLRNFHLCFWKLYIFVHICISIHKHRKYMLFQVSSLPLNFLRTMTEIGQKFFILGGSHRPL